MQSTHRAASSTNSTSTTEHQYHLLRNQDDHGDNFDDDDDDDDLQLVNQTEDHPPPQLSRSDHLCLLLLVSLTTVGTLLLLLNFQSLISSLWSSTHPSASSSITLQLPLLSSLISSSASAEERKKYLINTPTCRIESIPPFTNDTRPLYEVFDSQVYKCPPDDETAPIVRVNYTWVSVPVANCTAVEILRNGRNEGYKFGRTFHFGRQLVMNFEESDAVQVTCPNMKHHRIVPLIPVKVPIWRNAAVKFDDEIADDHRLNILGVGVDSTSRLNFLRHFTTTRQLIEKEGFSGPLLGLHKIGDNTFPNLIGMFSGIDAGRVDASLPPSRKLDDVPLIFKEFSARNYLTSYLEEQSGFGLWTFHGRNGFRRQPLEYLMRPVNILVEQELYSWYCYKGRVEFEMYYDYMIDQMLAFRERGQRFLNFIHLSYLTHDLLNYAQYADGLVHHFLERIFQHQLHRKTLILFYSDHGIRYGPILRTDSGFQESRMPFIYVYVPEGMRLKDEQGRWMDAGQIRKVFNGNAHRLSSQFDVHATLRHMLKGRPPAKGTELYGHSLFSPIPLNRTCEQAGIPAEFCLCNPYVDLMNATGGNEKSMAVTSAVLTTHLMNYLNGKLRPYAHRCTELTLLKVVTLKISADLSQNEDDNSTSKKKQILLRVQTAPNKGIIEAILLLNVRNGTIIEPDSISVAGSVIRLDRYSEQSRCAANTEVETFCYCKNLLRKGGG